MTEEKKEVKKKSKLEKAKEQIGDLSEAIQKNAAEKKWKIEIAEDLQEPPPPPEVKLVRKPRIGDAVNAEEMARVHWARGVEDFEPTNQQIAIAKLSLLCTFNGEQWNLAQIEELGEDFFTSVFVLYAPYIGSA